MATKLIYRVKSDSKTKLESESDFQRRMRSYFEKVKKDPSYPSKLPKFDKSKYCV